MLWIPGPTEVRPELLAEMARPTIGHRSAAMTELIERLDPHLRLAFGMEEDSPCHVAVNTSSATGMMEASLRGVGGRVLSIVGGAFAKRWHQIALSLGLDATALEVEPGQVVDDTRLADVLDRQGPFDAITLVVNETSNGTCTPVRPIANVLQAFPDVLLLCDVVSLIAGAPVDVDYNGIDFALAGVNKALALPPGVTVFCASEAYLERAREQELRGWYLDPVRIVEGHEQRKTHTTPNISLYYALAKQLEDISTGVSLPEDERAKSGLEAWKARYEKHARMRQRTLAWAEGRGLGPFPLEPYSSPTVSCLRAEGVDVPTLVGGLGERGFRIGAGYGDLKATTFRIGHMGDHTEEGLENLLAAADDVLGPA